MALVAGAVGFVGVVPSASAASVVTTAMTTQITNNSAHASQNAAAPQVATPHHSLVIGPAPQMTVSFSHVFTVDVTTDSLDAKPGDGVCSDAAGTCSLRAAIQEADTLNVPVQIVLSAVTYTLSIAPNNATTVPDDITSGDLNITDQGGISIVGSGATVDATGMGDRLLEVGGGASLWMSSATLTGGTATNTSSHSTTLGGALALPDATSAATLQGVTLTANAAGSDGGAIYNNGALWLGGSTLSSNSAVGPLGGGLYNADGSTQVVNDTITGNTLDTAGAAGTVEGGGIFNNDGPVAVGGSTISGNRVLVGTNGTGEGGGIYAGDETTIDNSTIASNSIGAAPSAANTKALGGGVANTYGLEAISNSKIDLNTAIPSGTSTGEGGGIYDDAGLALTNTQVTNNSVAPGSPATNLSTFGGGISIHRGTEQVTNSLVDHNSAIPSGTGRSEGGGIYNASGLTVVGSTVSSNTAGVQNQPGSGGGAGGGIAEEGNNALISASQIVNNQALGGDIGRTVAGSGGGILADDITSISNSLVAGNHADRQGGGIWSDDGQHVTADTITGNTAQEGGGIWNEWQMEVVNSTISGNSTSGTNNDGGGVFDLGSSPNTKVVLSSSTVANNTASAGSGLSVGIGLTPPNLSGFVLQNTIVGTNQGSSQCNLTGATLTSQGHNLSSDASCNLVAEGDVVGVDPVLLGLADNGGPTPTQALAPTSPAINAGTNVGCPPTDQRGISRPQGSACDIGAYEYVPPTPPPPPPLHGYWLAASDGGVFSFGNAAFYGSMGGVRLNNPVVGMAATPSGLGYWLVASDGGVFSFGDAAFYGSMGDIHLNNPVVAMAASPSGHGYWLVASDGGVFNFGDAGFYGSAGGTALNKPIVGIASGPSGHGYWLVASDGGVFAFGDAAFYGSMGGTPLNKPMVTMAASPSGNGYWLFASDGGVFTFGDGVFYGSMGGMPLNMPIVGADATPLGAGYYEEASDGGVFTFGDAAFYGSMGGTPLNAPIVTMAVR
jgi:hypothetical protein